MPDTSGKRIAIVFGATGLVGRRLLYDLLDRVTYSEIIVFNRRPVVYKRLKIKSYEFDFEHLDEHAGLINGDDLYLCLGTTIRQAGSVKKMEEIDRDLPIRIAKIAHANGVSRVAVVSSIGANPASKNYYLRIKGEMEEGIRQIGFQRTVMARPSILLGKRKQFRFGEWLAKGFIQVFGFAMIGPLAPYRGIQARTVARALAVLIGQASDQVVYESAELQKAGKG